MKKLILIFTFILITLPAFASDIIKLPPPKELSDISLWEAIKNRKTSREFSAKNITTQDLSNIMFVAYGITHDSDKRTIPTSRNHHKMSLYAVLDEGVYHYNAVEHNLKLVTNEDLKPHLATQTFIMDSKLTLIFTGADKKYSPMHAGSAYQNVGLYCTGRGLNNVVRGMTDKRKISEVLKLPEDEILITQTIGYPHM